MALAAVRSKVVVLLLLIHYLLFLSMFVEFCGRSLSSNAVLCVISNFVIPEEKGACCFILLAFLLSRGCK